MNRTSLAVIRGLTYFDLSQVFNRWLLPTYRTTFRWTGNRADSEDAAAWAFFDVAGHVRLPELVQVVDDHLADAALEAVTRHWAHRYGVDRARLSAVTAAETAMPRKPEALFESLDAQMRLVLVLRFLRRRSLASIAAQLDMRPDTARRLMIEALAAVARSFGVEGDSGGGVQAGHVSAYVDDIVNRRKPIRFEVLPEALPALLGATNVQASIAGNALPEARFVRSLERRLVTTFRIWSA